MTAPDQPAEPADDLRDRIAASVRHHIDHEIIAEWICCDPVNPSHHLCWWGEGVRQTMRSLLADNDDEYPSKAIDGITADLQPVLDAKDAEIKRLNEEIDGFCEDLNDALNHNDETCEAVKDRDRWRQRAEDAEAETARLTRELAQARADLGRYDHYATQIGAKELDT